MKFYGFQKMTMLDFPGRVACTVFTGGCNFRCPFCHNASLVTHMDSAPALEEEQIIEYITKRKNILDGVCITGGEPLLQHDIARFCQRIHDLGLLIKLDTNGSYPDRLKALIDMKLIDYIAMDIKNSKEEYAKTCGLSELPATIEESIRLIRECGLPYEFRTTVVRELHSAESMVSLAEWISGAEKYFLQGFTDSGDLIGEGLSAYSEDEMKELLSLVKQYVPSAELRGI